MLTCKKDSQGFTLVELLVVAAIVGILLAVAIPNLIKARISANEANARKSLQTLRDAEYEFFEGDLDNDGLNNFTNNIGTLLTVGTLRCPAVYDGEDCTEADALIDGRFENMVSQSGSFADCADPSAGYCITFDTSTLTSQFTPGGTLGGPTGGDGQQDSFPFPPTPPSPDPGNTFITDFGWMASPVSVNKSGRKDFATYSYTRAIHCTLSTLPTGHTGEFEARDGSAVCY